MSSGGNQYLFLFAVYTAIIFCVLKIAEMRFVDGEVKPLRDLVREIIVVGGSALMASYGYSFTSKYFSEFINFITENKIVQMDSPEIFTDVPAF